MPWGHNGHKPKYIVYVYRIASPPTYPHHQPPGGCCRLSSCPSPQQNSRPLRLVPVEFVPGASPPGRGESVTKPVLRRIWVNLPDFDWKIWYPKFAKLHPLFRKKTWLRLLCWWHSHVKTTRIRKIAIAVTAPQSCLQPVSSGPEPERSCCDKVMVIHLGLTWVQRIMAGITTLHK